MEFKFLRKTMKVNQLLKKFKLIKLIRNLFFNSLIMPTPILMKRLKKLLGNEFYFSSKT